MLRYRSDTLELKTVGENMHHLNITNNNFKYSEDSQSLEISNPSNETLLIRTIKKHNKIINEIDKIKDDLAVINKIIKFLSSNVESEHIDIKELELIFEKYNIKTIDLDNIEKMKTIREELLSINILKSKHLQDVEIERCNILKHVEQILQKEGNPNLPEVSCYIENNSYDRHEARVVPVKIYPLHIALDKDVIILLLEYGANINMRGYISNLSSFLIGRYYSKWDGITPLEAACLKNNCEKANILLSASHMIDITAIENSLSIMLDKINEPYEHYYHPHQFHHMVDILVSRSFQLSQLEVIQKLSGKCSEKFIIEQLEFELFHEKKALQRISSLSEEIRYNTKLYMWYQLIKQKIDIYKNSLNQKMCLSIWVALLAGYTEKNNILRTLPFEILKYIMNILFHNNIYEMAIAKRNAIKLDVFNKIYSTLIENGFEDQSKLTPIFLNTENFSDAIMSAINDKDYQEEYSLIKKTWQLTLKSYDNFSLQNIDLLQTINNKKKVDAFKIIQTIMSENDSLIKPYDLIYIHPDASHERIIACIEEKISNDQNNRLTIEAWRLSINHFSYFSGKNNDLIEGLAKWIIKNNKTYHALSTTLYKLTIFESVEKYHLSSIKDDIIKRIDELTSINNHKKSNLNGPHM